MDVSAFIVSFLVLCYGGLTTQFPQQNTPEPAIEGTTESNNSTTGSAANATLCETARGVRGLCLERQYCDYSTYAIDLTLYSPKWYKKSCGDKETCCPFGYQLIQQTETKNSWELEQVVSLYENLDEDDK